MTSAPGGGLTQLRPSPAAGRHAPVSRAMTSRAAAVASRESSALAARESGRGRPASGRGCCRGLEGPAPAGPAAPGHGRTRRAGRAVTRAPQTGNGGYGGGVAHAPTGAERRRAERGRASCTAGYRRARLAVWSERARPETVPRHTPPWQVWVSVRPKVTGRAAAKGQPPQTPWLPRERWKRLRRAANNESIHRGCGA